MIFDHLSYYQYTINYKYILAPYFIGYFFWLDYSVDPNHPPPPLITLVKPVPINPLTIWNAHFTPTLQVDLEEAERRAMQELIEQDVSLIGERVSASAEGEESDDESVFGETAALLTPSTGAHKSKAKKTPSLKTDIQFLLGGIANIKAAVRYMLDVKIASNVVAVSTKEFLELSYDQLFQVKTVTTAEVSYYKQRQTTQGILEVIDTEIQKLPEFEWYPRILLSSDQLRQMELQQQLLVDQATAVFEACSNILVRRKESIEREVVNRVTNEAQMKADMKAIEREVKKNIATKEKNAKKASNQLLRLEKKQAVQKERQDKKQSGTSLTRKPVKGSNVSAAGRVIILFVTIGLRNCLLIK